MLGKNSINLERSLAEKHLAQLRKSDLHAFLVHFGKDIQFRSMKQSQQLTP